MSAIARAGPGWCQELGTPSGSHSWGAGIQELSRKHYHGAGSEERLQALSPHLRWEACIASHGLTHCAIIPECALTFKHLIHLNFNFLNFSVIICTVVSVKKEFISVCSFSLYLVCSAWLGSPRGQEWGSFRAEFKWSWVYGVGNLSSHLVTCSNMPQLCVRIICSKL